MGFTIYVSGKQEDELEAKILQPPLEIGETVTSREITERVGGIGDVVTAALSPILQPSIVPVQGLWARTP